LANLPDLSNIPLDDDDEPLETKDEEINTSLQHIDNSTVAPTVHKLSDEEKSKYQPLFNDLVDAEKLHLCHGKPAPTTSVATLQKKSLVELRKAHHAVCLLLLFDRSIYTCTHFLSFFSLLLFVSDIKSLIIWLGLAAGAPKAGPKCFRITSLLLNGHRLMSRFHRH
jgi:hypothetical protein